MKVRPVQLKERRLANILEALYRGIIHRQGQFASVTMETHAPQIKYYPGSEALRKVSSLNIHQGALFSGINTEVKEVSVLLPGTPLHRVWLWFAVHEDLQDDSEQVYRTHCKLFTDHPYLYQKEVLNLTQDEFIKIIKAKDATGKSMYKTGAERIVSERWLRCARTLFEEFDGDPVALLKSAGWSVESVYAWKQKQTKIRSYDPIPGWGRKLISLYFLYLAELGYNFPQDAFPADLHAQALVLQTGCLDWGDKEVIYSAPLAEMIRKFVTDLCRRKNWEVLLLAHAQWLRGSFLCNGCASNPLVPSLCEIYKSCGGRIDTGSYTAGKWYKKNLVHSKHDARPQFGLPIDFPGRQTREKKRKRFVAPPVTGRLFPVAVKK